MKKKVEEKDKVTAKEEKEILEKETVQETKENEEKKAEAKEEKQTEQKLEKEEKEENKEEKPEMSETEALQLKLSEMSDKYMRLSAEFDNYRKRTLKEKMEMTKTAGEETLKELLPFMDNFDRALKSLDEAKEIGAMKEGIELIHTNFKDFLKRKGVKEIEAIGKKFDADLHEAITKIPAPEKKLKGKIVDCIEKGYYLNDKIIRYSKVVIGE